MIFEDNLIYDQKYQILYCMMKNNCLFSLLTREYIYPEPDYVRNGILRVTGLNIKEE